MAINEFRQLRASTLPMRIFYGDAVPTDGTYVVGDRIINTSYAANAPMEWVCTVGGATGGTWQAVYASPKKITFAAAVPTTGTYAKGDIIFNTAPDAGGPPGWVCTTAGDLASGGVVKAMGNLAA